jgi:hypothetical protein
MRHMLRKLRAAPLWVKVVLAGVAVASVLALVAAGTSKPRQKQIGSRGEPSSVATTSELDDTETLPPGTVPPTTVVPESVALAPSTTAACRTGDPLANVYHPYRLEVVKPCTTVSGVVETVRHEPDGDYHFDIALDAPYAALINAGNARYQHGYLVAEIVPADEVGCTPGQPPRPPAGSYDYGICTGVDVPVPAVGTRVSITGPFVIDHEHGWAEIHPVWHVADGATGTAAPPNLPAQSTGTTAQARGCDPSYPDFCIPPAPPDLDCKDVAPHHNFTVLPPDPHHFDSDHDGKGCET